MTAWSLWAFPHQIWPFQKFCWFLSMREAEWSHRSPCVSVLGTRVKSKPYNDNVNVFRWYGNLVPQSHFNDMLNERFESVLNFLNKLSCVIMTMPSLYSVVSDSIFILSDITKQRALSRCKKISVSLNQPPAPPADPAKRKNKKPFDCLSKCMNPLFLYQNHKKAMISHKQHKSKQM